MKVLRLIPLFVVLVGLCGVGLWVKSKRPGGVRAFFKSSEPIPIPGIDDGALEREKEAAQKWDDKQVEREVRGYVFEEKARGSGWFRKEVLLSLGARTHAAALAVLRDKSVQRKLTKAHGEGFEREVPIERLCKLLGDRPPEEVIEALGPFLSDPEADARQAAAEVVAKVGTVAIIEPVRKALKDENEYVRSHTLSGLAEAVQAGHLDEQCKKALFPDVQALMEKRMEADEAAAALIEFDQARAVEFFLSPGFFKVDSETLHDVLEVMADRKVPVPRERLLKLAGELEATKLEYPQDYALAATLRLLGQHRQEEDRAFLEKRMDHPDETVAGGASEGLLAFHGLEDFEDKLWDLEEKKGWDALSKEQKYLSAVHEVDGEINNGGHSQYFSNSSGDHWREALAGMEAMGFKQRAQIFREAVAKFGKGGPSPDRDKRGDQQAKLERKDEKLFDALDDRYYDCKEHVEAYTTRYVIKNAEAFR
jgi:hypothetical protein